MAATAQSLMNTAVSLGYLALSDRDLRECLLVAAQSGGGGGGGNTQSFFNNYAGGTPTDTPTGTTAFAVDTSNGTFWEYYLGQWH